MSGPHLFNVCLNELEIKLVSTPTLFKYADDSTIVAPVWKGGSDTSSGLALFKYADDSTIVAPVWKGGSDTSSGLVEKFLTWANCNSMSCNPNKCKELAIKKKGNFTFYPVVCNIPQHATLDLLGLTF